MKATLSLVLILLPMILKSQGPLIIAHRGASFDAPENTLAAVHLAWAKDADAVEIDVHLSLDNRIMVIHDKDTRRTTGTRLVVRESLAEDLRNLEAGSFKDSKYSDEKIPFLEEVMETLPIDKYLFIEVKCDTGILPFLAERISLSRNKDRLVVISFDFEVVAGMKNRLHEVPAFWLHNSLAGGYSKKLIKKASQAHLDGLNFNHRGITEEYVAAVHEAGLKMFTWTVDDPEEARRLTEIGIDGITTNRPAWLKEKLVRKPD